MKKSIVINQQSHKILKKLANEHNRHIGQFTQEMILYFQKTGSDPRISKGKSTTDLIRVVDRRIVSFFKTQEHDILLPMQSNIYENQKKTEQLFEQLIDNLNTIFRKIKQQYK